ncbi:uncharacterized protein LOC143042205 [Mytilus galloprovincialis]|uniref:uncharacterized protein LOC143042205 n=2 Tax=Mytilus galloprovincialis TaxID=29158 RepID=UPI003F7BA9D9
MVTARCHRSQKKNESPHEVEISLVEGPALESSNCSCAIGKSGTCGHVTGLLYTLAHMKVSNLKSIPSDILKTSLPQTWHIPRGEKLKGSPVDDVVVCGYNSKSPYRQPRGLRSTLYNPSKIDFSPVTELCEAVAKVDSSILMLSVCNSTSQQTTDTKFGKFPTGSAISYQQKLSSHYILNILDEDFPILPVDNVMLNTLQVALDRNKTTSFNAIQVSMDETRTIEVMTRLQSNDPRWHAVRRDRLTASVAGDIVKRRADNEPLVARLKTTRKVVTESMRHGLTFEAVAADSYAKLQNENVNIFPSGIIVSPFSPWLAASPDRKLYNPAMLPPYGLLEIKCPVKPLVDCLYLRKDDDGNLTLKKNHNYYQQVIMQLAVTGLKWCHFYVWRADEQHLETIEFDDEEWGRMKTKLDLFYFNYFLD